MSGAIPYIYQYPCHFLQRYTRYNIFNHLNLFNLSRVEHENGQLAVPCCIISQKGSRSPEGKEGKPDTETSSDSDDERAAEAQAKRSRDKEHKLGLTEVKADSERVDCMITEAEAKNQAKMAKLAEF